MPYTLRVQTSRKSAPSRMRRGSNSRKLVNFLNSIERVTLENALRCVEMQLAEFMPLNAMRLNVDCNLSPYTAGKNYSAPAIPLSDEDRARSDDQFRSFRLRQDITDGEELVISPTRSP